ncbi:hypothetical protein C1H46_020983 [Malus baccata]|uniref:Uncharacterized protein n=1 Tax=Malus baccata TaxID=106549 RepID=A0A540M3S6_MALBA|nr:hypothetical protein C1H46_020983 [Malus baccata]
MEESWTKLITLCSSGPRRSLPYEPLCFRKSGEVLSVWRNDQNYRDEIVSLDLVSKQLKNHGIREYDYYFAESYDESLVLLDDNIDAVSY